MAAFSVADAIVADRALSPGFLERERWSPANGSAGGKDPLLCPQLRELRLEHPYEGSERSHDPGALLIVAVEVGVQAYQTNPKPTSYDSGSTGQLGSELGYAAAQLAPQVIQTIFPPRDCYAANTIGAAVVPGREPCARPG
jgi:hypothetical protein